MGKMLAPTKRPEPKAQRPFFMKAAQPRPQPTLQTISSEGFSREKLADLRLADFAPAAAPAPKQDTPTPVKKQKAPKVKKAKPAKEKKDNILDRPVTWRRHLKWAIPGVVVSALGVGVPLADKYTGGAVVENAGHAAVATADFMYRHLYGEVDKQQAIEWGMSIWKANNFFKTDPVGLARKNYAASKAVNRHWSDPEAAKQAILPTVFMVDKASLSASYIAREMFTRFKYPDTSDAEMEKIMTDGFLNDIRESYNASRHVDDLPLSDRDILLFVARYPEIHAKFPKDLREGLARRIYDERYKDRKANRADILPAPRVQPALRLEPWQVRALEAELPPPYTAEERARADAEMDRAMAAYEESRRPKTIGEIRAEQQEAVRNVVPSIRGEMQTATQGAVNDVPSKITVTYCTMRTRIMGGSFRNCIK